MVGCNVVWCQCSHGLTWSVSTHMCCPILAPVKLFDLCWVCCNDGAELGSMVVRMGLSFTRHMLRSQQVNCHNTSQTQNMATFEGIAPEHPHKKKKVFQFETFNFSHILTSTLTTCLQSELRHRDTFKAYKFNKISSIILIVLITEMDVSHMVYPCSSSSPS